MAEQNGDARTAWLFVRSGKRNRDAWIASRDCGDGYGTVGITNNDIQKYWTVVLYILEYVYASKTYPHVTHMNSSRAITTEMEVRVSVANRQ